MLNELAIRQADKNVVAVANSPLKVIFLAPMRVAKLTRDRILS